MPTITADQVTSFSEITLAVLPVFALAYLVSDNDKVSLARGYSSSGDSPEVESEWLRATQRVDATLGALFALLTAVGLVTSLLALLFSAAAWMVAIQVLSLGAGLSFILSGISVNFSRIIDESPPPSDELRQTGAVLPSVRAIRFQSAFALTVGVLLAYLLPVVTLGFSAWLLIFLQVEG